jgi:hypothetical protein
MINNNNKIDIKNNDSNNNKNDSNKIKIKDNEYSGNTTNEYR